MCRTSWGCAVQAEAHTRYRLRVCSTGWGMQNKEFLSACTSGVPQPVLRILNPYYTQSACTAHPQPILPMLYTGWVMSSKTSIPYREMKIVDIDIWREQRFYKKTYRTLYFFVEVRMGPASKVFCNWNTERLQIWWRRTTDLSIPWQLLNQQVWCNQNKIL